jgi:large subunit ribosomal protein L7/L12
MATDQATREFSPLSQELGEKIVGLTLKEAKELSDYLEEVHGIKPAAKRCRRLPAGVVRRIRTKC